MPTRKKRRNERRRNRNANRNVNHTNGGRQDPQTSARARRDSIAQSAINDSEQPPSVVDSDECSSFSLSSAEEDYISNLFENFENGSTSDTSDVVPTVLPREPFLAQHSQASGVDFERPMHDFSSSTRTDMSGVILEQSTHDPSSLGHSDPSDVILAPETSSPPSMFHPVIVEGLRAFEFFLSTGRTETQYVCHPEKSAVVRLALHKAAEAMGATSKSNGKGNLRRVVMSMEISQQVTVTKNEFGESLKDIVEGLFSVHPKKVGRVRQKDRMRRLRAERQHRKMMSFLNERTTESSLRSRNRSKRGRREKSPEERVGKANVGYGMLERMGWKEGQGLGAEGEGLREPLAAEHRSTRAGLGC
ncbi:unnamed protein product [Agarophyton chilense]|eukprot:gb/GEZJ01001189.1/.p2 GENE.gb/GEZJ01001189.1/~~gb/GEZJ01001189.1/.p2  ORF type:complete len:361 (-),score=33.84 gb/GEZJ01001189.1/:4512-5594(-)